MSQVDKAKTLGTYILSVTTTPKAWHGTVKLSSNAPRIRTALGLHPQIAHERINELDLFDSLLSKTRYVGEIGLDGSPDLKEFQKKQITVFEHILHSATKAGGKILSIHSRRAHAEVLAMLNRFPSSGIPVLHWFSGSKNDLMQSINIGCWFSVGPAMLSSKKGREIASHIPKERIITETDGPFAKLGGKSLLPGDVSLATKALSEIWGVKENEAELQVFSSFKNLLSSCGSDI